MLDEKHLLIFKACPYVAHNAAVTFGGCLDRIFSKSEHFFLKTMSTKNILNWIPAVRTKRWITKNVASVSAWLLFALGNLCPATTTRSVRSACTSFNVTQFELVHFTPLKFQPLQFKLLNPSQFHTTTSFSNYKFSPLQLHPMSSVRFQLCYFSSHFQHERLRRYDSFQFKLIEGQFVGKRTQYEKLCRRYSVQSKFTQGKLFDYLAFE